MSGTGFTETTARRSVGRIPTLLDLRVYERINMPSAVSSSVKTSLNGYFAPDFSADEKIVIDVTGGTPTEGMIPPVNVSVGDARQLQQQEDDGSAEFVPKFFSKHGFVLLDHESSVENWDSGAYGPSDALAVGERNVKPYSGENEIESRYLPEIEEILRSRLLPGHNLEIMQPPSLLRRGPKTANPFFGLVVHNDYGVSADDFQENTAAFASENDARSWRDTYERDEVRGFMMINFWRTVHMKQPLEHMPLGILDASSVNHEDLVSSGLRGFAHTGRITNQLSLRFSEGPSVVLLPKNGDQ